MKNILLVLLSVVVISGCSKDDADSSTKNDSLFLVKKATTISDKDKSKFEVNYEYSGNKLLKIVYGADNYVRHIYTGNLITEIERFDGMLISTTEIKYDSENKLTEVIFSYRDSKYYTKYFYFEGKIELKEYSSNNYSDEYLTRTGIYYLDSKGNIKKREFFNKGILQGTTEYTFDNQNNEFKNVVGLHPIFFGMGSVINNTTSMMQYNSKGEKIQDVGAIYTYNNEGYPISFVNLINGERVAETFHTY